ncbi:MAG TPA: dethiobiotin synthase, partial [Steroidobacteraceae bacterium]|nr:dethiobiotin synthase [Steroidobacteraceae bacterium]
MNAPGYFIAGTDTGVGKTRVTAALLAAGHASGLTVVGMKPVASGAELICGRMASADAVLLAAASGQTIAYEDLNPYCLELPISPHIAAKFANIEVDISKIVTISKKLLERSDLLLIEGAGGWYTPISEQASMADLARALGTPVVLVVGLKLGCLNHARLSLESIRRCGCPFAGWIGNHIDPGFAAPTENLAT